MAACSKIRVEKLCSTAIPKNDGGEQLRDGGRGANIEVLRDEPGPAKRPEHLLAAERPAQESVCAAQAGQHRTIVAAPIDERNAQVRIGALQPAKSVKTRRRRQYSVGDEQARAHRSEGNVGGVAIGRDEV